MPDPAGLFALCDAGRILGPADPYDVFWNLPCAKYGTEWVTLPAISPDSFWLCPGHAKEGGPSGRAATRTGS